MCTVEEIYQRVVAVLPDDKEGVNPSTDPANHDKFSCSSFDKMLIKTENRQEYMYGPSENNGFINHR